MTHIRPFDLAQDRPFRLISGVLLAATLAVVGCHKPGPSRPVTLKANLVDPDYVAVDDTGVYVLEDGHALVRHDGRVLRLGFDPSDPVTVLADGQDDPVHIALDQEFVFWITDGALLRVAKTGGDPQELIRLRRPQAMAIDERFAYVAAVSSNGETLEIVRVSKAGGEVSVVTDGLVSVTDLAVDDTHLFWTDRDKGTIRTIDKTASFGNAVGIAFGQVNPVSLTLHGDYVYWITDGSEELDVEATVVRVHKKSGRQIVIAQHGYNYSDLTVGNDHVYWSEGGAFSSVLSVKIDGSDLRRVTDVGLAADHDGLALHEGKLYITSGASIDVVTL